MFFFSILCIAKNKQFEGIVASLMSELKELKQSKKRINEQVKFQQSQVCDHHMVIHLAIAKLPNLSPAEKFQAKELEVSQVVRSIEDEAKTMTKKGVELNYEVLEAEERLNEAEYTLRAAEDRLSSAEESTIAWQEKR